jgi:acyl carrier protein
VSGKVDRKQLPSPDGYRPAPDASFQAPRTETEQVIAEVWSEVLGLEAIGIHDNFFDLGGHSLLVTRLVTKLRAAFGCDIGVRAVFDRPTVALQAEAVKEALAAEIALMTDEEIAGALDEAENGRHAEAQNGD